MNAAAPSPRAGGGREGGVPRSLPKAAHPPPTPPSREGSLRFAGYAALFDRADAARDTIRPGAFAASLAARRDPLPLYWQHRPEQRIGWVEHIEEDARGLRVIGRIDNPEGGAGLALRHGAATGLSFGFRAREAAHSQAGRELRSVDIFEVSLVTRPMQHGARVHLIRS